MSDLIEKIVNWTVIVVSALFLIVMWLGLYWKFPGWRFTLILLGLVILVAVVLTLITWGEELRDWFNGEK